MIGIAKTIALMPGGSIEGKVPEIAKQLDMRVTLAVDPSGEVIADSEADAKKMENHLNRPGENRASESGGAGQGHAIQRDPSGKHALCRSPHPGKGRDERVHPIGSAYGKSQGVA